MTADREFRKHAVRVLKAIGRGSVVAKPDGGERVRIEIDSVRTVGLRAAHFERMISDGLLQSARDGATTVTPAGVQWLRRVLAGDPQDGFQVQHQERVSRTFEDEAGRRATITVNLAESPLAWLARRRGKDGKPFLEPEQIEAGERLRADFARANLSPRITASWQPRVSGGGHHRAGLAALTDAAIDSRQRVHSALDFVGPELGSVLLDVCCFLKGLEAAEQHHGWPARTGKVVLKIALDRLAAHYGTRPQPAPVGRRDLAHWGTPDYRPTARRDPLADA